MFISKHCLQEALVYFEKEFSNCLKVAQIRYIYFFNMVSFFNKKFIIIVTTDLSISLILTLAMDKAEKLKANLNLSNQSAGENEASNFQVGEEALEETLQEEDNCTFM
ncbi:hypothetical protein KSF78_0006038 [Schistosoma japonicum]|nr:hypothetical protein KSF78_0006038 [Schistosoma japonicum]